MAAVNETLIPTTLRSHLKGGTAYLGIVTDLEGNELWQSPVTRDTLAMAEQDAQEAVDAIADERRNKHAHDMEMQS